MLFPTYSIFATAVIMNPAPNRRGH